MFSYICGEIIEHGDGCVVINNNDIGYEIYVSDNTMIDCAEVGRRVQLYLYMHISEDKLTLYGFSDKDEKDLFMQVISVSGVGCKTAITLLGSQNINNIKAAIVGACVSDLCVKGIGKKTAEKIILELKDKISAEKLVGKVDTAHKRHSAAVDDATEALASLGLSKGEISKHISNALNNNAVTAEEIIKFALKNM